MEKPNSILPAYLNIPGEQTEYPEKNKSSEWPNIWLNPTSPFGQFYNANASVVIFEEAEDSVDEILRGRNSIRSVFN